MPFVGLLCIDFIAAAAGCLQDIRLLSAEIAAAVIKTAAADGHVCDEAAAAVAAGHVQLLDWVRGHMFTPTYSRCACTATEACTAGTILPLAACTPH